MIKVCSRCDKEKNYPKDFSKGKKKKDGSYYYSTYCKICKNKQEREHMLKIGKVKTKPHNSFSKDLLGKKFGKLTIIQYIGIKKYHNKNRHTWLCKCDCGNIKECCEYSLKRKHIKSCGCLSHRTGQNNPLYKGCGKISGRHWSVIKAGAKKRNLKFDITIKDAWDLFEKQDGKCALSGRNLYFAKNSRECGDACSTASLNRIDSHKGYIKGNVQWLHKHINIMKLDHTQEYFISLCQSIVDNIL